LRIPRFRLVLLRTQSLRSKAVERGEIVARIAAGQTNLGPEPGREESRRAGVVKEAFD
jgi:hypothetical protein